ncbi:hypothetical protein [Methylobacterium sp. A52T]
MAARTKAILTQPSREQRLLNQVLDLIGRLRHRPRESLQVGQQLHEGCPETVRVERWIQIGRRIEIP